jgi:hypothetical protein
MVATIRRTSCRFITDISTFLRDREQARYGRAHPQTVSIFGPELINHPATVEPVFRHPNLDFASTHLYEKGHDRQSARHGCARALDGEADPGGGVEATDLRPSTIASMARSTPSRTATVSLPEPFGR